MTERASVNLRAAAEHALDPGKLHTVTSEGQQILAAVNGLVGVFASAFESVHKQLKESEDREVHLHDCVERLAKRVEESEAQAKASAHAHAGALVALHTKIDQLNDKVDGLNVELSIYAAGAMGTRSEMLRAADRAEAARRYVDEATREVRSERATEPSLPCARDTDVSGSEFVIPTEHFPKFESYVPTGED